MRELGIMLPDELADFTLSDTISVARRADDEGLHSVWKGETSGTNGFMTLSAVAQRTESVRLGTGVVNVFSRSPTLIGMSILTLDELSGERALLGLGTSSEALIEQWHGMDYARPLRHVHETIDVVRTILGGGTVEYDGELFDIGPYPIDIEPSRAAVPIFNAAIGPANRRLTGRFADGWMPILTPRTELESRAEDVRESAREAGRDPDSIVTAPWIPAAVADDRSVAEAHVRMLLAQEMAVGYYELFRDHEFAQPATQAHRRWREGDRDSAAAAITDEMLAELTIYGEASDCRAQLERYYEAGAELPILWPSFEASPREVESMIATLSSAV